MTSGEAKPSSKQHRSPCGDCPFRRDSLAGWLGGSTAQDFVEFAHGDDAYPCHAVKGPQCAGMAIYRANICKSPRDPATLVLPANKVKVFAWPTEFIEHHGKEMLVRGVRAGRVARDQRVAVRRKPRERSR